MSNFNRKLKKKPHKKIKTALEDSSLIYANYTDRVKAFITDLFMIYTPILYAITYVVLGNKEAFQRSTLGPLSAVLLYGVIYALFLSKTALLSIVAELRMELGKVASIFSTAKKRDACITVLQTVVSGASVSVAWMLVPSGIAISLLTTIQLPMPIPAA